jgi:CheY-like chemotaxis protein
MSFVEYLCIFVRAAGDRLRAAERLVLALPHLVGDALVSCDLRYRAEARFLEVTIRLRQGAGAARGERIAFWTARAGGRAVAAAALSIEDRARLEAFLASPSHDRREIPPAALFVASGQFFTDAGAPTDRRRNPTERPRLVMDVGGPGWDGVQYQPEAKELFVAAPIAPPVGDDVELFVRVPGDKAPIETHASVTLVRAAAQAGPGAPAGYTLKLVSPPAGLERALGKVQEGSGGAPAEFRAAPRFQVNAPVRVLSGEPARRAPAERTHATIEYASDQELAADYIQNLSQGGAFVRTSNAPPVGAPVELQLRLPNGVELKARAAVAFVNPNGMGLRFQLDPEADAVLSAAMAHISARPRRALVVDDDALVCRMLADALRERGFEVLTATDAKEGLSALSEELLALDLLVTDVVMPGMGGEDFVRLIRKTGGEVDLAIVCVSGQLGTDVEKRLELAGADAVLDKELGPDLIAQAADAVLERKRLIAQDG